MRKVAAIVLAAGYSSRMQGAFKPLLMLGDYTVVEHAVKSHREAGIQDIRVVVGHRAEDVAGAVKHLGVQIVTNPHFDLGMFSSVQAGVAALNQDVEAFFIQPVDIPLVDPCTIRALLNKFEENPRGVTYPVYKGRRGHPPLITGQYIVEIMTSPAPDGLRGILKRHEADACGVEVDDEAILLDMDTLKDFQHILAYRDRKNIPSQKQCMGLLDAAGLPENVLEHCRQVHAVVEQLVCRLNNAGAGLNASLASAAALLHDIKRLEKDHAQAGAMFLKESGYPRVAEIVAAHMDIEALPSLFPTEAEIVYLADKMVKGRRVVPLEQRFAAAMEANKQNSPACAAIRRRQQQAEKIKKKVESVLGCPLEEIPLADLMYDEGKL